MKWLIYIKLAFKSFRRNMLRTLLTGLGIVISIASVIIVISAAQGVKGFIIGQFDQFGSNLIQTEPKLPSTNAKSGESQEAMALGTVVTTLTIDDMKAIRKLPNIKTNYAGQMAQAIAISDTNKKNVNIMGATAGVFEMDTGKIASGGRQFTEEEDNSMARVVILGAEVAKDLFGDQDPVGQKIKLKQKSFEVIGVYEPRGSSMFFNFDIFAYVPLQTLQKQILGIDYVSFVSSQYIDKAKLATTVDDIEQLLKARHNIDSDNPDKYDFFVQSTDDVADILDTIIGGFTILLVALAGISLIVGGVGIMNIMYVTVLERTFEIGLRKAVGARRQEIMRQFLSEAIVVTMMGGIVGIIVGVAVSYSISVVAGLIGFKWAFVVPLYSVILATGFSAACGLIFGLYPARKAADLDPIEALRKE